MSEKPSSGTSTCSLCHAPLDTSPNDACSAMAAIAFSQLLSSKPAANQSSGNQVTESTNQNAGNRVTESTNDGCCKKDSAANGEQDNTCCGEGDGSCKSSQRQTRWDIELFLFVHCHTKQCPNAASILHLYCRVSVCVCVCVSVCLCVPLCECACVFVIFNVSAYFC